VVEPAADARRRGGIPLPREGREPEENAEGEHAEMTDKAHAERLPGRGWLKNGNPPGNPGNAPRQPRKDDLEMPKSMAVLF
jgi:hypothetical protein